MFSMLLYMSIWSSVSLTDLHHVRILTHMHFAGRDNAHSLPSPVA